MLTILNSLCPISHDEFIVCKYAKTDFKHLHTHMRILIYTIFMLQKLKSKLKRWVGRNRLICWHIFCVVQIVKAKIGMNPKGELRQSWKGSEGASKGNPEELCTLCFKFWHQVAWRINIFGSIMLDLSWEAAETFIITRDDDVALNGSLIMSESEIRRRNYSTFCKRIQCSSYS